MEYVPRHILHAKAQRSPAPAATNGAGERQIARSCSIGHGTVYEYLKRAQAAGVSWPSGRLDDRQLEAALLGEPAARLRDPQVPADFAQLHEELQRHPNLTLQLAWEEYRQAARTVTPTAASANCTNGGVSSWM